MFRKLIISLCIMPMYSFASIELRDIYFTMDDSMLTEYVSNGSENSNVYIATEVKELIYHKEKGEFEELELVDSRELMVTPRRFVVPTKKTVPIKIIARQGEELKRFRVKFKSVSVKDALESFSDVELANISSSDNQTNAAAELLISYGTVVYVNPINKLYDTRVSRAKEKVVVRNGGNSVIKVTKIKICEDSNVCSYAADRLIVPSASSDFEGQDVSFNIVENDRVTPFNNM